MSSAPPPRWRIPELVLPHGHHLSEHFTTTDDGYVLRLFRIPPKRQGAGAAAPVVLLQHALMDSSAGWLLLGRRSLALSLAEAGWDVWLGNARGNRFSRNHSRLSPDGADAAAFWSFSWDHHALHDLPASVSAALAVSGAASLVLVGFSQVRHRAPLRRARARPRLLDAFSQHGSHE